MPTAIALGFVAPEDGRAALRDGLEDPGIGPSRSRHCIGRGRHPQSAGRCRPLPEEGGSWLPVLWRVQGQGVERTGNRGERLGRHMQIATRGTETLMA
jgi:hypothetical protein